MNSGGSGGTRADVLLWLEQFRSPSITVFAFLSELLSVGRFQLPKGGVTSCHAPASAEQHLGTGLVPIGWFVAGSLSIKPAPDPEILDPAWDPPSDSNKDVHHDIYCLSVS